MVRTKNQGNRPEIDIPVRNVQEYTIKKNQLRDQESHGGKS